MKTKNKKKSPPKKKAKSQSKRKTSKRAVPRELPTLEKCEKAIGEPATAWVARCYEISCAIVAAGLVDGEAVYGHWLGEVARGSHFADRGHLPFIQHGWIQLKDGRVLDPTRWVFENRTPYLYVGEEHTHGLAPCENCQLISEEHREGGPDDRCDMYEPEKWPYDEGGNQWREAMTLGRPRPVPEGPKRMVSIFGTTGAWVSAILDVNDATELTSNQLFYLANFSYSAIKQAVGAVGLKMIYDAIASLDDTTISWIPADNANRARRECGFKPA